ncbi:MAG TPA: regulatory iron-sulfur-containing complex subunit RicT [Gemmatimonadaceae bacterium]|nr:regulatory iron-sulfur-containing complex subunit RicT [Gemmatimonadaceae bacterium]
MASHLVEVEFKGNRREFFLWETDDLPALNAPVIVEADRGEDLGRVHAIGEFAEKRNRGVPHGIGDALPTKRARRVATAEELKKHDELRAQDEDARRKAMERVRANALVMKVSDAEWQWDKKKLTFYFTAEKRVDFRTLVRELAATFRTRIELKQIGVRDEARRLDGIGRCGRQYCSAAWLPELRPVSLGVAKDQRLSLNPTQISGACGRLMCSLRYEHEFYVQARKRFPKEGKTLRTTVGEERVVANDIFRERVVLRNVEGETRTIPLAQLLQETGGAGAQATSATAAHDDADAGHGVLHHHRPDGDDEHHAEAHEEPAHGLGSRPRPSTDSLGSRPRPSARAEAEAAVEAEAIEAEAEADAAETAVEADGEADKRRPHRRRGRRGGRRGRSGRRDGGGDGSTGGGGTSA